MVSGTVYSLNWQYFATVSLDTQNKHYVNRVWGDVACAYCGGNGKTKPIVYQLLIIKWWALHQKQVSRARILWGVITCTCPWYLFLRQQISRAGTSNKCNYNPQNFEGCNYVSRLLTPPSCTTLLTFALATFSLPRLERVWETRASFVDITYLRLRHI